MPMYSSTEYLDNCSKILGSLRQYYRHGSNDDITESESDGYQRAFASLFYKCFDKKTLFGTLKSVVICYEELAEELSKPSIRKFEKRNVHTFYGQYLECRF